MKRRKANQQADLHRHVVGFAPTRGLQTGVTYRARISDIRMAKGRIVLVWNIYRGTPL